MCVQVCMCVCVCVHVCVDMCTCVYLCVCVSVQEQHGANPGYSLWVPTLDHIGGAVSVLLQLPSLTPEINDFQCLTSTQGS